MTEDKHDNAKGTYLIGLAFGLMISLGAMTLVKEFYVFNIIVILIASILFMAFGLYKVNERRNEWQKMNN